MPRRRKISPRIQEQVRQRARHLCEYCHTSEQWQYVRFTVDHIVPLVQGGSDTLDNLALACFHCNRRKSRRVKASDPESGEEVPLFSCSPFDFLASWELPTNRLADYSTTRLSDYSTT